MYSKIVVIDSREKEYTFEGTNMTFYHEGECARIYNKETKLTYASFTRPISIILILE